MLATITWTQLQEWMAFAQLEPFDEERADWRSAQVAAMIANANRNPKKRKQPYPLHEFVLNFGDAPKPEKKKQSWQEQKNIARMLAIQSRADRRPVTPPRPARPSARIIRRGREANRGGR